jgi:hypothetical protein
VPDAPSRAGYGTARIFVHLPADVWQKLFTQVSPAVHPLLPLHAMSTQPCENPYTGPV